MVISYQDNLNKDEVRWNADMFQINLLTTIKIEAAEFLEQGKYIDAFWRLQDLHRELHAALLPSEQKNLSEAIEYVKECHREFLQNQNSEEERAVYYEILKETFMFVNELMKKRRLLYSGGTKDASKAVHY
jgi:hypothetical protein